MISLPALVALAVLASLATTAHAALVGDTVTTYNTVEDSTHLGGQQFIFGTDSATIGDPGSDVADVFVTGLPTTPDFINASLVIEFDAATDLTNLGVSANVDLPIAPVPLPSSLGFLVVSLMALLVIRRKRPNSSIQVE